MARLPIPGGDKGNWGTILNDYLSQIHEPDGTLKTNSVGPDQITDGSISESLLDSDIQARLNQLAPTWGTLNGKPAVIAAGADQATARAAIDAQANLGFTPENIANRNQPNGYVALDNSGKIAASQISNGAAGYLDITMAPYNAVPDGVTDNAAAIQLALDDADGRPVYVPPGIFAVGSTLTMNPGQVFIGANSTGSAWLSGSGPDVDHISTLKALGSLTDPIISGPTGAGYVQLRDLNIDGNSIASNGINLIASATGEEAQWLLQRLFVHHCASDGIYIGAKRRAIRGSRVVSCYNGRDGIRIFASDSAWHDSILGTNTGNGFYCAGTMTRVTNSDIFGNTLSAIKIHNGVNEVFISNNSCDRNGMHGVDIGDGCFNITIFGNLFTHNSSTTNGAGADIYMAIAYGCVLIGNCFYEDVVTNKVLYNVYLTHVDTRIKDIGNQVFGNAAVNGYINAINRIEFDPALAAALASINGSVLVNESVTANKLATDVPPVIQGMINTSVNTERDAVRNITNARIVPRVQTQTAPGATPTINLNLYDQFNLLGLTTNITALFVGGTASDGQRITLRLRDNGTPRNLAFGSSYRVVGVTAPTATVANKLMYIEMIANVADSKIDIVDIRIEA